MVYDPETLEAVRKVTGSGQSCASVLRIDQDDQVVKCLGDDGVVYWAPRPGGAPSGSYGQYFRNQASYAVHGGQTTGSTLQSTDHKNYCIPCDFPLLHTSAN